MRRHIGYYNFVICGIVLLPTIVFGRDLTINTSVTIGGPAKTVIVTPPKPSQNIRVGGGGGSTAPAAVLSKPSNKPPVQPTPVVVPIPISQKNNSAPILTPISTPTKIITVPSIVTKIVLLQKVRYGDRSVDVKTVQQILTRQKLLIVPRGQEGIFGPRTKTAIIVYQKKKHLKQTGVIDASTAAALLLEL